MKKNLFESIESIIKRFYDLNINVICKLSIESFYNAGPDLWVNFLNADAMNEKSIWLIYKEAARFINDFKEWIVYSKYDCPAGYFSDVNILSFQEFLKTYWLQISDSVETFQAYIVKILDSYNFNEAFHIMLENSEDYLTLYVKDPFEEDQDKKAQGEAINIPEPRFTIIASKRIKLWGDCAGSYENEMDILMQGGSDANLWLSVILGSMLSSLVEGKIIRRCAASDCRRYFIPSLRSHNQLFHSQTCHSRYYMRERRKKNIINR